MQVSNNRFRLFLTFSALLHCSAFVLFSYYGPQLKETTENLVPVEVMVIRDVPLVSLRAAISTAEPKVLTRPPSPITKHAKSSSIQFDIELMDYVSSPTLTKPHAHLIPSVHEKREARTTPLQKMVSVKQPSTPTPSIHLSAPDDQPFITLKPTNGLIAVSSVEHPVPLPDLKTASSLEQDVTVQTRVPIHFEDAALDDPVMSAPESDPIPIQIERPLSMLFPGSAQGASFVLLVDTSGSVKGNPLEGIKASAIEFISLMGTKDRVGLMTLNDHATLINDMTSKNDGLKHKINTLQTAGKLTVLYDALLEAARSLKEEPNENLHIVLFSDGKDEGSQAGLEQVIETLKQINTSVLAVGFTRVEEKHLDVLRKIADDTGGVFVQTPEFRDILSLYKTISPAQKAAPYGLTPNQGTLLIKSDPMDADVYVDGKFLGTTPMLIQLPMGTFNLLLRNQCCYDWQAQIELSEPGELPLYIKLERLPPKNQP